MFLVFDTETSGKAHFKLSASHPSQPRLVQLGAQLLDDELKVRAQLDVIVKPVGFVIPEEASSVHGITQEIAERVGLDLDFVLDAFVKLASVAHTRIAHNLQFDDLVMAGEFHRADKKLEARQSRFCTMKCMTNIMNLPGPYGPKWPKLSEAYEFCTQQKLEGAHDALTDVRACVEVYRWLGQRSKEKNESQSLVAV